MKFRFTIANRLSIGFGIIMVAVVASFILIYSNLENNSRITDRTTDVYSPSVNELNSLYVMINNSKMLIKNWVFIEQKPETPDKIALQELHELQFPTRKDSLLKLAQQWLPEDRMAFNEVLISIEDSLFVAHQDIMEQLQTYDDYTDPAIFFEVNPKVEQDGEVIQLTDRILKKLFVIVESLTKQAQLASAEMKSSFLYFRVFILVIGVFMLLASSLIAWLTTRTITRPIEELRTVLELMSKGIFPKQQMTNANDEIGDMSRALEEHINNLSRTAEFSLQIGEGNLDFPFQPISEEDSLGKSLLNLRSRLATAEEEERKRKEEDQKRNWATNGLAKFADVLRQNNDNLNVLSDNIIQNLINYTDANQGGLFIYNDEDPEDLHLELVASYAYDRKKFLTRKIMLGEGLVGTCALEKQTIYMTDLPSNYVYITSGLGRATPRNLLIVPLRMEDRIFGVIEIASFYEFPQHVREFVEQLGESIASSLFNVRMNARTAKLLEHSRRQAEEMAAQEEEMRQNMEELQATQEEMHRQRLEAQEAYRQLQENERQLQLENVKLKTSVEAKEQELEELRARLGA